MEDVDGLFRNSLNKDGKQGSSQAEQASEIMPGTGRMILNKDRLVQRTNEVQIHKRTIRALCSMDDQLTTEIIEVITIVDTYLELFNRHHENESILLNWSVNSRYYEAKQRKAISQAVMRGFLERYGKSITISPKGDKVLRDYNRLFEDTKEGYLKQAETATQKPQRKPRNVRRPGEPSRIRTRNAA